MPHLINKKNSLFYAPSSKKTKHISKPNFYHSKFRLQVNQKLQVLVFLSCICFVNQNHHIYSSNFFYILKYLNST